MNSLNALSKGQAIGIKPSASTNRMKDCTLPTLERWPTALPAEVIGPALAKVEVALHHGNEEEAHAAVRAAFEAVKPPSEITLDSSLVELGLPQRVVGSFDRSGILTVRQLCELTATQVHQRPNFGSMYTAMIRNALEKHGFELRRDTEYTANNPMPKDKRSWLERVGIARRVG